MAKWIIAFSLIVAGIVLAYFYKDLGIVAEDPGIVSREAGATTIVHSFKDGIHRYGGEIQLPHSCYSVVADARRDIEFPSRVLLALMTRDGMTDLRICAKIPTRYPFETYVEAPVDVHLIFSVDDKERPTRIIETAWQNPRGTILNLENISQ